MRLHSQQVHGCKQLIIDKSWFKVTTRHFDVVFKRRKLHFKKLKSCRKDEKTSKKEHGQVFMHNFMKLNSTINNSMAINKYATPKVSSHLRIHYHWLMIIKLLCNPSILFLSDVWQSQLWILTIINANMCRSKTDCMDYTKSWCSLIIWNKSGVH